MRKAGASILLPAHEGAPWFCSGCEWTLNVLLIDFRGMSCLLESWVGRALLDAVFEEPWMPPKGVVIVMLHLNSVTVVAVLAVVTDVTDVADVAVTVVVASTILSACGRRFIEMPESYTRA